MKVRTMEKIEPGFRWPATSTVVYSGETLECNVVAEVKDAEAEMLIAAGIAEPAEVKDAEAEMLIAAGIAEPAPAAPAKGKG